MLKSGLYPVCLILLSIVVFWGCATVHQPIGFYQEESERFFSRDTTAYETDSTGGKFYFPLSVEKAVDIITAACYDLDIPLYYPLKDSTGSRVRLTSGNFVAKRDVDFMRSDYSHAYGRGADLSNGIIEIDIEKEESGGIWVSLRTMFFRTESFSGDYANTKNVFFSSTGRIEKRILDSLRRAQ